MCLSFSIMNQIQQVSSHFESTIVRAREYSVITVFCFIFYRLVATSTLCLFVSWFWLEKGFNQLALFMQYIFLHQICSQLVPCRLIEMFWAHCKWSQTSLTTLCSHFFLSWDNQVMIISRKIPNLKLLPLKLWNSSLTQVFSHKHLGLILTPKLTWNEHIKSIRYWIPHIY